MTRASASSLQKNVVKILSDIYPQEPIAQEYPIKIGAKTLYLDAYLPRLNIAFENDGEQHSKFNKFFHSDIMAFRQQQKNDKLKEEFCEENAIILVRVNFDDKLDKEFIVEKILQALKGKE